MRKTVYVPICLGMSVLEETRRRKVKEIMAKNSVVPLQRLHWLSLETSWPRLPLVRPLILALLQTAGGSIWRAGATLDELVVAEMVKLLWTQKDSHGKVHDSHSQVAEAVEDLWCLCLSVAMLRPCSEAVLRWLAWYCLILLPRFLQKLQPMLISAALCYLTFLPPDTHTIWECAQSCFWER